jgi:transcriptional regulator with XRE-family HTH domain
MERGKVLQLLLEKHGTKQTELADKLGIAQNTISGYINNKLKIPYKRWNEILEIFGETETSIAEEPDAAEYRTNAIYDQSNIDTFYQSTIKTLTETNNILSAQIDKLTTIIDKLIAQIG